MKSRMTLIAAAVIAVGVWSTGIAAAVTIAKPTLLVATATSSTTVSLSWHDASNNEIGFEIQRSPAKKTAWKKIATAPTNASSFADGTGLTAATAYKYRIRALKPGSGASSFSNTATVTTLGGTPPGDTTAPTTPGGSSVSATSRSATLLSWLASTDTGGSGLKDYAIWRDGVVVKYVTGLTTTDTGLTASHTYSYAVQARDNANNVSGKSAAKSVTTAVCSVGPIIPAPQQFNVTADSCAFAFATWNTIYDPNNAYHVTKYNVYRNNVLVKTVPAPGTAPTASTVDTPLVALTSYSYAVTAADAAGHESAKSTSVSVTTSACEPGGAWVRTNGAAGSEFAETVTIDGSGNTIVGGTFRQTADFGHGPVTSATNGDMYIAKYGPDHTYQWAKQFHSDNSAGINDEVNSVATDAAGNVYVAGAFFGTVNLVSTDPCPSDRVQEGCLTNVTVGYRDAFVAKYSAAGVYQWSRQFGSTREDYATAVKIDSSGTPVVTGVFWGQNVDFTGGFKFTNGPLDPQNLGYWRTSGADAFVVRLNPATGTASSAFQTRCGGIFPDGMALDSANNVVLTGTLQVQCTSVFGTTPPSPQNYAAFVAKFNPAGQPTWGRILDGDSAQRDDGHGVAVDGSGNVVATGTFTGAVKFGDATRGHAGDWTAWAYLVKLNGSTGATEWSKAFGTVAPTYAVAYGYDVTADATGKVTVVGAFQGTVDFGGGALYTGMNGSSYGFSAYVAEYSPTGAYIAAKRYGSGVNAQAKAVTNGVGGAVVAGFFTDTVDFGFGPVTSAGFTDVFILNSGR